MNKQLSSINLNKGGDAPVFARKVSKYTNRNYVSLFVEFKYGYVCFCTPVVIMVIPKNIGDRLLCMWEVRYHAYLLLFKRTLHMQKERVQLINQLNL